MCVSVAASVSTSAPANPNTMNHGLMIARSIAPNAATNVRSSVLFSPGITVCAYSANAPVIRPMVSVAPSSVAVRMRFMPSSQPRNRETANSPNARIHARTSRRAGLEERGDDGGTGADQRRNEAPGDLDELQLYGSQLGAQGAVLMREVVET